MASASSVPWRATRVTSFSPAAVCTSGCRASTARGSPPTSTSSATRPRSPPTRPSAEPSKSPPAGAGLRGPDRSEYDRASVAVNVVLSEIQRDTLRALCDTFVPSLSVPGDLSDFYARSASDLGVPQAVETSLGASVPEDQLAGLRGLLDAIAAQGFADAPPPGREAIVRGFMEA